MTQRRPHDNDRERLCYSDTVDKKGGSKLTSRLIIKSFFRERFLVK